MQRTFLPENLKINSWDDINPYFEDLQNRIITNTSELKKWLKDRSELESTLEEDMAWRYIKMNCDTTNEQFTESFNYFVSEIEPKVSEYANILDKKYYACPHTKNLNDTSFKLITRQVEKDIELFRKENIPINAELQKEEQEYGKISGEMSIQYKGTEYTLQQAVNFLKDLNRETREKVYQLINNRRLKDSNTLNELLTELIIKRQKIATNTNFENYRDYKHKELGRFDYSIEDCFSFHEAIKDQVVPITKLIHTHRKEKLELSELKPWDLEVDQENKPPLKPFESGNDLIDKTISMFSGIRPKYGEFLSIMKKEGYLDLESKKGKAPGGFNYPLYESNIPFIFMNASGNLRDLETMVHEGGHAIHSFLSSKLEYVYNKQLPSEVAELASMSMELISMDYWNEFFDNEDELKRAKRSQLEGVIQVLPWVATIDKFQHWLYKNPEHSIKERNEKWLEIFEEFGSGIVNWEGQEMIKQNVWQKQLHIFEVPFYYIEYGISQLGAIAIWKNFKGNKEKALDAYENALSLGYTNTIPEIYKAANIKFDFSKEYLKELMSFVKTELEKLY